MEYIPGQAFRMVMIEYSLQVTMSSSMEALQDPASRGEVENGYRTERLHPL
jgi:hypothetical protein